MMPKEHKKSRKNTVNYRIPSKGWEEKWDDLEENEQFLEMVIEEKDPELEQEIAENIVSMEGGLAVAELECMFSGEHDTSNAIMAIHAGAGGTEAQDWVEILMRMYLRWAENRGLENRYSRLSGRG